MEKTTKPERENSAPPPEAGSAIPDNQVTFGAAQAMQKDAYYRCSHCGGAILSEHQMVTMGTLRSNNDRFHAACLFANQSPYGQEVHTRVGAAPMAEQLASQVDSTMQGPWSSVVLTKNSKGYTHELKLYFPPDTTPEELEERGAQLLKVIEKLESIKAEGRYDFNE